VLADGRWPGLRELCGIVTAPVLRPDGTLLTSDGYDNATGLLYVPGGPCDDIPAEPTRDDALRALYALREVVCDFPFVDQAHLAAWIAALLTPLARPAIGDRNVPLFLIDGNTRGCGKSRLVDCIALIVTGRTAPREQFAPDPAELDKRITAHLQASDSLALIDNVTGSFGSPVLDALLTSEGWYASRLLGKNTADASLKMRNRTTWYATANNATLSGDLVRRAVYCRLETRDEHPEERAGWRHPDLPAWVRAERPRLLAAALTILRAWFVAGRPCVRGLPSFGSFEAWSDIVRAVCRWLELADPWKDTRDGLREADPGDSLHAALLAGLAEMDPADKGVSTGEIKRRIGDDITDAKKADRAPHYATFQDALGAAGILEDGKVNAKSLGRRLQLLKGKRKDGRWIESAMDAHAKTPRWHLRGVRGVAGSAPIPSSDFGSDETSTPENGGPARYNGTARETPRDSPYSPQPVQAEMAPGAPP